jgi:hypothetical protein
MWLVRALLFVMHWRRSQHSRRHKMAHPPLATEPALDVLPHWRARCAALAAVLAAVLGLAVLPACVGGPHPLPPESNNGGGAGSGAGSGGAGDGDIPKLDAGSVGSAGTGSAGTGSGGAADAGSCVMSPDAGMSDDAGCAASDEDAGALGP